MICPTCGSEIADNSKYCNSCGNPIAALDNTQSVATQGSDYQSSAQVFQVPTTNAETNLPNKKTKKPNIPGLFAGIAYILGAFLPYAGASIFGIKTTISLIDGADSVFFIAAGILAIICAIRSSKTWLIVVGGIALLLAGAEGYNVFHDAEYAALYSREIGYFCTLIGSIGIIASGLFWNNPN